MKIVFVVYHDLKTEARSAELLKMLQMFGDTTVVSYAEYFQDCTAEFVTNRNNRKGIVQFLRHAAGTIRRIKPDLVLLHDPYATPMIRLIRKKLPKCRIVYDSSELRLLEEKGRRALKAMVARQFLRVERKYIGSCDLVLAANRERAEIMREKFGLRELPLIFDNVHKIEGAYDPVACDEKFGAYFAHDAFYALYAGGVAEKRQTYQMTEQIGRLGAEYRLLIVGAIENGGKEKLAQVIQTHGITNVSYLGFVAREELKYLMERSHVTISAFAMDTLNNINCASGKVYEGLFVGKPLLAGENPPLRFLCQEYGVGVSTANFGEGLQALRRDYARYVRQVRAFVETLDYENRIARLKETIESRLYGERAE